MFCALYILALDSKEMAVSFPASLIVYELLWHPPALQAKALRRWLTRQMVVVWIMVFNHDRLCPGQGPFQEQGISNIGGYRMTVSAGEYFAKLAYYLNEAFYARIGWTRRRRVIRIRSSGAGALSRCRSLSSALCLFLGGIFRWHSFMPAR